MNIRDIIRGKREWRAHKVRVAGLPREYQAVYREIQKYLFKVGPADSSGGLGLLTEIVELFEAGAARGDSVLKVTGRDVAGFCDGLIGDTRTYADIYREAMDRAMEKAAGKAAKKIRGKKRDREDER